MWIEVKARLREILKTLTVVEGTKYTVADYVPKTRSDFHGYLIVVHPNRDAMQPIQTPENRTHTLAFAIEVTSPQVSTDTETKHEYRIEAYADAITALLDRYPRLESVPTDDDPGRKPLTGVQQALSLGVQFQTPRVYPTGGVINHYSVTINYQVTFKRATGC